MEWLKSIINGKEDIVILDWFFVFWVCLVFDNWIFLDKICRGWVVLACRWEVCFRVMFFACSSSGIIRK